MERAYALAVSAVLLSLVISPALRDPPRDSFPLSDYPMFSRGRPDPGIRLTHALGVTPEGDRVPLSPLVASGNREVLQAMMSIHQGTHRSGARGRADFCDEIAGRVAEAGDELSEITHVELATSEFDAVAYFDVGPEPVHRRVHHRCEVPR